MIITLYCDGSIIGNPGGTGAWCCIAESGGRHRVMTGYEYNTTNNRMEMEAVLAGLRAFTPGKDVTVYSDSEYVVKGFTEGRVERWAASNWTRKTRKRAIKKENEGGLPLGNPNGRTRIPNYDLWMVLADWDNAHNVRWQHYRGQHGNPDNLIGADYWLARAHQMAYTEAKIAHEAKRLGLEGLDIPRTVEGRLELIERISEMEKVPDPPQPEWPTTYAVFKRVGKVGNYRFEGPYFLPMRPHELRNSAGELDGGKERCEQAAWRMSATDDTKAGKEARVRNQPLYVARPYMHTTQKGETG